MAHTYRAILYLCISWSYPEADADFQLDFVKGFLHKLGVFQNCLS